MRKFSYEIRVQDLIPPIRGVYRYFAVVAFMYESKGGKEVKVEHSFSETHGQTKQEAEKKMREDVEEWIKNQQ